MKQTWRLIGRSVDTFLVIAHWEFLMSLETCMDIIFIWALTCWFWWLIILIGASDVVISSVFHWYIRLRHWHADYIDWSYCLAWHIDSDFGMIVLITSHAYTHHCISLSLTCFSYLYTILIIFEHVFLYHYSSWLLYSRLSCVYMVDIYLFCVTVYCMTLLIPCDCMSCLSMWAALLSTYLQISWSRSFPSFWFSLLQVWDLLCACSLTELEIRSRV